MSAERSSRSGSLVGTGAAILALICCLAGPAVVGAIAGAGLLGAADLAIAVPCIAVLTVALVLMRRRRGC